MQVHSTQFFEEVMLLQLISYDTRQDTVAIAMFRSGLNLFDTDFHCPITIILCSVSILWLEYCMVVLFVWLLQYF